ncbi:MAG: hypothetical protein QF864_03955 [SAR202 cluster bacterium]|nr:hypothetical protein [SAR202 cluster bacterium]
MRKAIGIIILGLLWCNVGFAGEKSNKSVYDIKIGEKIDNILSQKQIKLYYRSGETSESKSDIEIYGKDKKYSIVVVPNKANIFLHKFDNVQLIYNNENLKIEYIGGIKHMNVGKCLKERTKQMNLYIDQFDTKDSNIINKESKQLNLEDGTIVKRTKIAFPQKKMKILFSCYDYSNFKGSSKLNSAYRFEKWSYFFNDWLRNRKKIIKLDD